VSGTCEQTKHATPPSQCLLAPSWKRDLFGAALQTRPREAAGAIHRSVLLPREEVASETPHLRARAYDRFCVEQRSTILLGSRGRSFRRGLCFLNPSPQEPHADRPYERRESDEPPKYRWLSRSRFRAEILKQKSGGRPHKKLSEKERQRRQADVERLTALWRNRDCVLVVPWRPKRFTNGERKDHCDLERQA
jgi:hypothetical protein